MSPTPERPDTTGRTPRRRRIALLLAVLGVLFVAWASPVLLLSPDEEGRALIAAGVPRSEFPELIAEGGNAYAADTLAHDWADTCDRLPGAGTEADSGWASQWLATLRRFNPFDDHVDCALVHAIALRTEALRDDADDDTCTDDDADDGRDAPAVVAAAHRHRALTAHRTPKRFRL